MRTTATLPASSGPIARSAGFTLLELMMVITVAGVILGLGIPNMTQFVRNNRMTSAANDMLAAVHMARTEAVKRRAFTTMCFTANPNDPSPTCDNGGRGWIVFVDDADATIVSGSDGDYVVNVSEEVLLRHDPLPAAFTSMKKAPLNTRGIAFSPSGFSRIAGNSLRDIVLCDERNNSAIYGAQNSAARAITISTTGRPQVSRAVADITTAGDCP